jgi:ubiquinone/menaquinone biosynthesis C-methylase UbiE
MPRRPFYSEFAWAFNLLIDRPVQKECGAIVAWFIERGIQPGARVLDAGCGTGRYAIELARRGFIVDGVDGSPELIAEAIAAVPADLRSVTFTVGDLLALPVPGHAYDAVLCRGVLNDFLDAADRRFVFTEFARILRPGGVLALDVREWDETVHRKRDEPLFRKSVSTSRGTLTFSSVTSLDEETKQLLISEEHVLNTGSGEQTTTYEFVMQCWTRDEVETSLDAAGFDGAAFYGAYDRTIAPGETDRLAVIATRR